MTTDFALSAAPLASLTSISVARAALAGDEAGGALQVHHIDVVGVHVLIEAGGQLVPLRLLDRNEIFDADGIEQLTAETLGSNAGAYALAGRIDRGSGAGGAAAHDEHIVRRLRIQSFEVILGRCGIELGDDLREPHSALTERLPVEKHGGDGHDPAAARTSSGNSAPSIMVWRTAGFDTAITFSA